MHGEITKANAPHKRARKLQEKEARSAALLARVMDVTEELLEEEAQRKRKQPPAAINPEVTWKAQHEHIKRRHGGAYRCNMSYAQTETAFRLACALAGIEPTKRQASKFRRKIGQAWVALRNFYGYTLPVEYEGLKKLAHGQHLYINELTKAIEEGKAEAERLRAMEMEEVTDKQHDWLSWYEGCENMHKRETHAYEANTKRLRQIEADRLIFEQAGLR